MKGEKMRNWKVLTAVLGVVLWTMGLIPAWPVERQKLPSSTVADQSKAYNPIDPSKSPKPGCVPTTCEKAGADSGDISDGCGHVIHCGIAQKVFVSIDPPQYAGICPKTLRLTGTIIAKRKGKAYYSWMAPTAPGNFQPLQNGNIVFEAAGSKQVFLDYSVPVNLPIDQQRVNFYADGAEGVTASFKVICTQVFKPTEKGPLDPKQ
jgi:hypothetical protein